MQDTPIADVLSALGLEGASAEKALAVLYRRKLTRPSKARIANDKIPRVHEAITEELFLVCHKPECRGEAAADPRREPISVASPYCDVCGGQDNRRAVDRMVEAMRHAKCTKLGVAGGSPNTRTELKALVGEAIDLEFVTEDNWSTTADNICSWADIAVIWASTEISHKATAKIRGPHVRTVSKRGVAALADEVTRHLIQRGPHSRSD